MGSLLKFFQDQVYRMEIIQDKNKRRKLYVKYTQQLYDSKIHDWVWRQILNVLACSYVDNVKKHERNCRSSFKDGLTCVHGI
jgi:hypothetical protein